VNLNWLRPLWEEDQRVVKRTGKDEPMWVVIHICLEITQGISLYSYFYLKLEKIPCFSYYLLFSSSTKLENRRNRRADRTGSALKGEGTRGRVPRGGGRWQGKG
jgi:hypothetical protein